MTHTYRIAGMTCGKCQAKVQQALLHIAGVSKVAVDLPTGTAAVTMKQHIPTAQLQLALKDYPQYQLTEAINNTAALALAEKPKTWIATYKPIVLVLGYILGVTLLMEFATAGFNSMRWMNHFMAGFFLVFSFFKMLDLQGFAESYATYDIIAKRWKGYGYVYAFMELVLGIAYTVGFNMLFTNAVTFVVMTISIIGVLQSVLNKRKIRCACLGAVFNLPMSAITIIEDALMIGMSLMMCIRIIAVSIR